MKRQLPWVILTAIIAIYFAVFETLAFMDPSHWETLSFTLSNAAAHWPFLIYLVGHFVGTLSGHFFWAWPRNPLKGGG